MSGDGFADVLGDGTEEYGPGCDCTQLCSMGPTCPGGMLAEVPGSGCWRSDPAEADDADDLALINAVMTMPFDDLLAMALQEDEIDTMPTSDALEAGR